MMAIEKIELKNFRGFSNLTLEGVRRINIIVGPNGSGKTALMEGIKNYAGGYILIAPGTFPPRSARENFESLPSKKKQIFIDIMEKIFPDVEDVGMGNEWQGLLIYFKRLKKPIFISELSHGFNQIAGILLMITKERNSIALIDEIENGIHFTKYEMVLQAIDELSRDFGKQIFFTTHSNDILDTFCRTSCFEENDFSIIRCSREESGATSATIVSDEWAARALDSGIEIRV